MGFLLTNKEINEEINNYESLTFFKKHKNFLVLFSLAVTVYSFLLNYFNESLGRVIFGLFLYLALVPFIFFNHRWAMILFFVLYAFDLIYLIFFYSGRLGLTEMIFTAFAAVLTYNALRVATALKKSKRMDKVQFIKFNP